MFNHRSYFDPTVMGLLLARAGRNVRGLGKKEVFDVPVVGRLLEGVGGVRVERASGSDEPLVAAARALQGGELVMIAPQGTIPRGPAFFDPELKGRWGAAKLAAQTRVPVIPVGLWGTEDVWPRSARLPNLYPLERPVVTATVGDPVELDGPEPRRRHDADHEGAQRPSCPPRPASRRTPTDRGTAADLPSRLHAATRTPRPTRRPGTDT